MTIVDLGEWAEGQFSTLCAAAGVARNKAVQDRTGWDFLVEFPADPLPGLPIDLQPIGPSARVQVKSKRKAPAGTRLKLSNALRFAKSTDPCFIVLFVEDGAGHAPRIYARHAWEPFIATVLEKARVSEAAGRPDFHRQTLGISFGPEDDHTDDLLAWMRAQIAAVGGLYEQKKGLIAQTVGMEDGGIRGVLSFEEMDWVRLVDHQLGLSADFPVSKVTIKQRRFGVDAPMISLQPDTASMRPHPHPCKVRIRGADRSEVWLDGEILMPSFPELPSAYFRYRIKADILDLIFDPNDQVAQTAKASSSADDALTLEALTTRLALVQMLARGPLDVQVRIDGRIVLGAKCRIPSGDQFTWVDRIALAVDMLEAVAAGDVPPTLRLSIQDIETAWPAIVDLNGLVAGGDLKIRARLANRIGQPLEGSTFWAWGHANVGNWTFMAVVSRPILALTDRTEEIEIACGPPEIEDGLVRPSADPDRIEDLVAVYCRNVSLVGEGALELFGGDFSLMLKAFGPEQEASS